MSRNTFSFVPQADATLGVVVTPGGSVIPVARNPFDRKLYVYDHTGTVPLRDRRLAPDGTFLGARDAVTFVRLCDQTGSWYRAEAAKILASKG